MQAIAAGKFDREIVPVSVVGRKGAVTVVDTDEGPRPGTSAEVLSRLSPVVAGGEVTTAGNASSLNDGASAVVVASQAAIDKYGLHPRARIAGSTAVGVAPEIMGIGPVPATKKLLNVTGWELSSVDAIELNEAFASQSLACIRELGLAEAKVNAWGGAIALGHPLGSSGSRLVTTLLHRLEDAQEQRGIATLCVGVGQGCAIAIERV